MQQIITAKLKLITTPEQCEALRQTQLAYRDALNAVSRYAFERGKISNVTRQDIGMYAELRARNHLPSQLACSVERQVSATYKGLWTKLRKNVEHRRAKLTKKRFKGLDQPPHYSTPPRGRGCGGGHSLSGCHLHTGRQGQLSPWETGPTSS